MTPLDRLLKDIDPAARLVSAESEVERFVEGEPEYTKEPRCGVCGCTFHANRHPREDWRDSNAVSYRVADVSFEAGGEVYPLSDAGPQMPCDDYCWGDVQRRLKRDRLEAVEGALRLLPVDDSTVDWRARALEACEETRRAS